jgi:hypothetical protein
MPPRIKKLVNKKGSDTPSSMPTMSDAITSLDEGLLDSGASGAKRGKNFLAQEDLLAVQAYHRASENPRTGSRQKKADFQHEIGTVYDILRVNHIAFLTREVQSSVTISEHEKENDTVNIHHKYPARTGYSVYQRVKKHIMPEYIKFRSILLQVRVIIIAFNSVYVLIILFYRIPSRQGWTKTHGCSSAS